MLIKFGLESKKNPNIYLTKKLGKSKLKEKYQTCQTRRDSSSTTSEYIKYSPKYYRKLIVQRYLVEKTRRDQPNEERH